VWDAYATTSAAAMAALRSETWRAMEDALLQGCCRAIGVSNFTVQHLEQLRWSKSTRIWPPAVNQVEFHPLLPQSELLAYCRRHGIVVQAYASLGGQDTGQRKWSELLPPPSSSKGSASLLNCAPVVDMVQSIHDNDDDATAASFITPGQLLLRWAIDQGVPVIPKTVRISRLVENARALTSVPALLRGQIDALRTSIQDALLRHPAAAVTTATAAAQKRNRKSSTEDDSSNAIEQQQQQPEERRKRQEELGRLCWVRDPFRHLQFE
jgi:diketogulonate reductase-like aldo/keto reductase